MKQIAVISSSVREGRLSHRVALFLKNYIAGRGDAAVDLLDLNEYGFPLFSERLQFMNEPAATLVDYAARIEGCDGVVVVSPVYNASFPASLKNAVDVLYPQWRRKPLLVVSVTYGNVPGIATVQELQKLFLKLGARVASPMYTVIRAGNDFTEAGEPIDREAAEKFAREPVEEFMWLVKRSAEDR